MEFGFAGVAAQNLIENGLDRGVKSSHSLVLFFFVSSGMGWHALTANRLEHSRAGTSMRGA
jgi:hypothetical protein